MSTDYDVSASKMLPLVSARVVVAVPLYNEHLYLAETLGSLSRQEHADFKVLLADNASDDGSRDICEAFASADDRFVYVRHPNNVGAARNFAFCLDASSSDYFMWCGAHDVLSENFLATMIGILDASPAVAIAFGSRQGIDEDSKPLVTIDLDDGYLYRFSNYRLVRYAQAACSLSDCTIVNGMFRRRGLDEFDLRPVKSCDMVLLSHLLYFGRLEYDKPAIYFRRYFRLRPSTQAERISGKGSVAAMDDHSLADYFASDIGRLAAASSSGINRWGLLCVASLVRLRYVHPIGRWIRFLARLQVQPMRTLRNLRPA